MTKNNSCLVLGSNSFSGASFSKYLLENGYNVFGCSRSSENNNVFLPYKWISKQSQFEFHQYDINHDLDSIMSLITKEKIPYIVNFAAQSMVAESWENPSDWFMTNTVSSINLHDKIRKCSFLERYVHISTPEVYGSSSEALSEETMFNPSTPYAVSRAASDMSLSSFYHAYNFPVVTTRAANVFGPGQQLYRIIPRTILFILLGKRIELHGGGASRRSFIHIDDVSNATLKIMLGGDIGSSYHISTNCIITIRSLVEKICEIMGVSFDDHVNLVGDRLGKDAAYQLNSSKLRNELQWRENIDLDRGLRDCIEWVKNNFDELKNKPSYYIHKP